MFYYLINEKALADMTLAFFFFLIDCSISYINVVKLIGVLTQWKSKLMSSCAILIKFNGQQQMVLINSLFEAWNTLLLLLFYFEQHKQRDICPALFTQQSLLL